MSIVLVKKYKDKILIGADSQESSGESRQENLVNAKLRNIEENIYAAGAGDGHICSMFYAYTERHSLGEINSTMSLIEYFSKFNNWIHQIIIPDEEKMGNPLQRCQFVLIINGKIWYFADFYTREISEGEFTALGSGSQAASACMQLNDDVTVEEAINATCKVDIYCSAPIKMIEIKL